MSSPFYDCFLTFNSISNINAYHTSIIYDWHSSFIFFSVSLGMPEYEVEDRLVITFRGNLMGRELIVSPR